MMLTSVFDTLKCSFFLWILAVSSFTVVRTTKAYPITSSQYKALRHASLAPVLLAAGLHELFLWIAGNYRLWLAQLELLMHALQRYIYRLLPCIQQHMIRFFHYIVEDLLPFVQQQIVVVLRWVCPTLEHFMYQLLQPMYHYMLRYFRQVQMYCVSLWPIIKQVIYDGIVRACELFHQGIAFYLEVVDPLIIGFLQCMGHCMRNTVNMTVEFAMMAMDAIVSIVAYVRRVAVALLERVKTTCAWICHTCERVCVLVSGYVRQLAFHVARYFGDLFRLAYRWIQDVYAECRDTVRWFANLCWPYVVRAAYAAWAWICAKAYVILGMWLEYVWAPIKAHLTDSWNKAHERVRQMWFATWEHIYAQWAILLVVVHEHWTAYRFTLSTQLTSIHVALAHVWQDAVQVCYAAQISSLQQYATLKRDVAMYWRGKAGE